MDTIQMNDKVGFGNLHFGVKGGKKYFIAAEICREIGVDNASSTALRVPAKNKELAMVEIDGRKMQRLILNEDAMRTIVFSARKEKAKPFRDFLMGKLPHVVELTPAQNPAVPMAENLGLEVFNNPEFGSVRVVSRDGEPWFVAKDVCRALEVINPSDALKRLDEDERARLNLGRQGETNVVNEPGLYSLVIGSRKPEAKAFKRWITHDVIPAIRKTGGYIAGEEHMDDDELMARALLIANKKIELRNQEIKKLKSENAVLLPKAEYYDRILSSTKAMNVTIIAKEYGMTAPAFNSLLHDLGIQYKSGGTWVLYAKYLAMNYMKLVSGYNQYGYQYNQNFWTQEGRKFLYDFLKNQGIVPDCEKDERKFEQQQMQIMQ